MKLSQRKTGWIGFDLGATSVKVAQVVRTDAGPRIRSAAIVPRAERWAPGALTEDRPRTSADEIKSSASLCDRLHGANAASILPVAVCDVVQMDAPAAKRGGAVDLLRAIEAETHRPMRDRVVDSWPVSLQPGKINVVAAPRAWSDQVSADVAAAGWNCRVIDALPWALARAASLNSGVEAGKPIAALDWGYGKSTITLVHNGVPVHVRSLKDCAFQTILEKISQGLRLDERDAELLLQKQGLATNSTRSASVIDDLLDQPLARLTQELRRTLDFWRGITRGKLPEAIFIFGGGGTLAGIGHRLTEQLGIRVDPWQLPAEESADAAQMPPACLLGAAIGLSAVAWACGDLSRAEAP
jgi:Tfp pilus assembly PilM family ATPase